MQVSDARASENPASLKEETVQAKSSIEKRTEHAWEKAYVLCPMSTSESGSFEEKENYAKHIKNYLMKEKRIAPFISQLMYAVTPTVNGLVPNGQHVNVGAENAIEASLSWAESADRVIVFTDFGSSQGIEFQLSEIRRRWPDKVIEKMQLPGETVASIRST